MRAEDIVGVSFFALLIPAVVATISGSRTSLAPRQRALWRGWGLSVVSGAFIAHGLVSFQLIHNSPRPVVVGNLWNIQNRDDSSSFMITDATGRAVQISCAHDVPESVQGERARVRYVAYNMQLLDMDMLTGPYQPWRLQESSGEQSSCWWVAMGVICGFFAYRQLTKSRQPQTTDQ